MQEHIWILQTLAQRQEVRHQMLPTLWLHLYDVLEKENRVDKHQTSSCQGVGVGRRRLRSKGY